MSGKTEPFVQEIISLHKLGHFKEIINQLQEVFLSSSQDKSKVHLLHLISWPTPTIPDLEALASVIYSLKASHIHSIGCGTGLLEWLLTRFLLKHYLESENTSGLDKRVEVTGIEADFRWWTSSYAPPMFIPLQFVGKDFAAENPFGDFDDMVMFCYCNSIPLFRQYVNAFIGTFVMIIGPVSSCPCDRISEEELSTVNIQEGERVGKMSEINLQLLDLPETFRLPKADWKLVFFKRFGMVRTDHVAIYTRVDKTFDMPRRSRNGSQKLLHKKME